VVLLPLAAEPNYADPYTEEEIIHMKQKDYAAAETALRRALALTPTTTSPTST